MTNISVILAALIVVALSVRSYTWRVKALVFAILIVMIIVLMR